MSSAFGPWYALYTVEVGLARRRVDTCCSKSFVAPFQRSCVTSSLPEVSSWWPISKRGNVILPHFLLLSSCTCGPGSLSSTGFGLAGSAAHAAADASGRPGTPINSLRSLVATGNGTVLFLQQQQRGSSSLPIDVEAPTNGPPNHICKSINFPHVTNYWGTRRRWERGMRMCEIRIPLYFSIASTLRFPI